MLDGRIVGGVPVAMGPFLVQRLRYLKVKSLEGVSSIHLSLSLSSDT